MTDYISRRSVMELVQFMPAKGGPIGMVPTKAVLQLPAADVIPVDWILNYATEVDKDGSVVFSRNHIDTMLEEWRSQQ